MSIYLEKKHMIKDLYTHAIDEWEEASGEADLVHL